MKPISRAARLILVMVATIAFVRAVFYYSPKLSNTLPLDDPKARFERRKPSPQEIAASMNTLWDEQDERHCRNVCEASWIACRLRNCDDVPGVRVRDEL